MLSDIKRANFNACFSRDWSPVIGDPTLIGWVTVGAYGFAAFLALWLCVSRKGRPERWFWAVVFLSMAFLMVNKQLDLQSALTAAGRCASKVQGWYDERRGVQREFIYGVVIASGFILFSLFIAVRRHLKRTWLVLIGLCFLATFVTVRAAGFHDFDAVLRSEIMGIKMNWFLELGGIALATLNLIVILLLPPKPADTV
jgi:hypothetical protein